MKSINVKRIGTLVASTVMLGAALAAPVSAGADMTGVDKGFFYDANFNPIVQIVVGEKGMATDAVAAGNIAATVGNLAYVTKAMTYTPTYAPKGQVVIETSAIGATGDYIQDTDAFDDEGSTVSGIQLFYDKDDGFTFDGNKTYERGDFTQYALACEQQTRTEAGILLEGTYNNIHCLFCKTLCVEGLKNPSHEMKEKIFLNADKLRYYEDGLGDDDAEALKLAVDKEAIKYTVETGFIPLEDMDVSGGGSTQKFADFQYRGKIIFMGKEYYMKEIDSTKLYLAEGKVLDDITSEGYTSEFKGYKFKIDHLIYSGEYQVAGILLDVQKPDGTIVQTQISKMANGVVDNLEIAGVYAEAAGAVETASIIVYDTSSQVVLEDGEDLQLGGVTYEGWKVNWVDYSGPCNQSWTAMDLEDCDISAYDTDLGNTFDVLGKIEVQYDDALKDTTALGVDESLNFPSQFMLTFKGYMSNNFKAAVCSGAGSGDIKLERGSDVYQMALSFTASDGNRYNKVRMDEGPFVKGNAFIMSGGAWEYEKYKVTTRTLDVDDTVDVTLKPLISGSKRKITLGRFCDPDDALLGVPTGNPGTPVGNCTAVGTVTMRKIALVDAMKDSAPGDMEEDDTVDLDSSDLFWANSGVPGAPVIFFVKSSNAIVFSQDPSDMLLTIEPDMVGVVRDFDMDNSFRMELSRECGFALDIDANTVPNNVTNCDWNDDNVPSGGTTNGEANDDDLLVLFTSNDEAPEITVVDLTDRGYNEVNSYKYKNSIKLYNAFTEVNLSTNQPNMIMAIDEDIDTMLITPFAGDTYTLDWGVDNKIDAVSICHPTKDVDSTVFLGVGEQTTVVTDTVTKDDEGKTITAGCCSFKVKEFSVDVAAGNQTYTTSTVNKVIGRMVVPEVGADTTKNLVIVGGPVVNGMCTVTKEEIEAAADKFIVKKDGNLLIVAGFDYQETLAAGDALVEWLQQNIHK